MDLKFTDEQNMLRDMTHNLCSDYSGIDVVRKMENDAIGVPAELWEQMQQTGLLGMRIPEEFGGMGLNMLDCAVVYEQFGRAIAPGPYFDSTIMAASAILLAGDRNWQEALLPGIASGELIIVPAWLEPDNSYGPTGIQLKASRDGDAFVLNGTKRHVFYARAAHKLLVLARTGDDEKAVSLFIVDADTAGLHYEQQKTMATDTQYKLVFDQLRLPSSALVGAVNTGWQTWEAAMNEGIILLAAWAAGGAERALEITVQYSMDREQFGKPIGAFQSLAHDMANASTAVEGAKVLVLEAAWAHAAGKSTARLAPMAKLFACKTFRDVTWMAQQVHGGIGFTLDYDIQLYYRRAKQLQLNWWDGRYLEQLVAAEVLDGSGRSIDDPFSV